MNKLEIVLKQSLDKMGFLSEDNRISITNLTVMVFVTITAIRALLGGSEMHLGSFDWKIQQIDMAATLPMLFALLSYSHKRYVNSNNNDNSQKDAGKNE